MNQRVPFPTPTPTSPPQTTPPAPGGNGNGNRLTELERRMTALEAGMKTINDTVIEINTKMDGLASKSYVLTIFGMTGGLAVLTFIGHVLIRTLGST